MKREELAEEVYTALIESAHAAAATPLLGRLYCSDYRTLWTIRMAGGSMTPGDIAKILNVTTPRVTVILNALEKDGLIERSLSPKDRRFVNVKITAKGKKKTEECIVAADKWLCDVIEKVGEDDCKAALRFLNVCRESAEELNNE